MYKVTVENGEGGKWETEKVLCYDFITVEDVQDVASAEFDKELSEEQLKNVQRKLEKVEGYSLGQCMRWIIQDVLDEEK